MDADTEEVDIGLGFLHEVGEENNQLTIITSRDSKKNSKSKNSSKEEKKLVTNNKNDSKFDQAFQLLKKANEHLENIESNTRGGEKDVWYPKRRQKVVLYVRVSVVNVGDIDTIKQEFQCEFYMTVKWRELKLKDKGRKDIEWEKFWDPRLSFENVVSYDLFERRHQIEAKKNEVPMICLYYHIRGVFKEILEVNDFPFDYQDLSLSLIARWRSSLVSFEKDSSRDDKIRISNFIAKQEWDLQPHIMTRQTETEVENDESWFDISYPVYHIQMHARRHYSYYIFNVALIMCLITALTFSSFSIKSTEPGNRLQVTLTLLLTSIAFKYVISQSLPTVSYLTVMDKYIMCCTLFQFFMSVQVSISGNVKDDSVRDQFEWACFYFAIGSFVVFHMVFILIAYQKVRQVNRRMEEENRLFNENRRNKLDKNSDDMKTENIMSNNDIPLEVKCLIPK